ncbi:MAG: hypothetical protein ABJH98_02005 [Reichenbachiella sp.]|uniref:hypothetical protein n=1 Tax=Reichenbachiella sp. TaxID=2184521 RepID=UPI003296C679
MIRRILLISFGLGWVLNVSGQEDNGGSSYVVKSIGIVIEGKTNVNKFSCKLKKYVSNDTLKINGIWNGKSVEFDGLYLQVPVDGFNCGLPPMTADFRNLLKSEQYPQLSMEIREIYLPPLPNLSALENMTANTMLTIAGEKQTEEIYDSYLNEVGNELILGGKHELNMRAYQIEPPSKFFGTIVVQEQLDIEFEVMLQLVE